MKKINYLKLGLDIMVAAIFALLFNPRVLNGLTFHETAGVAIGAAILVHLFLNIRWVKKVTIKILDPKLSTKALFSYLLNIMLFIMMAVTIITGIFISRVLFPNLSIGDPRQMLQLHIMASHLTLTLVGVHLGLHWQWVMNVLKKMFTIKGRKPKIGSIAAALAAIALIIGGCQFYVAKTNSLAFNNQQMPFGNNGQSFNQGGQIENGQAAGNGFQNFRGTFNGGFGGRTGGLRDFRGRGGENPFSVIMTYFGIMAVIMIPTYYVEKRFLRKKSKMGERLV